MMKRALDVVLSGIGLVVLAVPFALIAVAIKLDAPGPVFFRHTRVGKDGVPFVPLKFRTMVAISAVERCAGTDGSAGRPLPRPRGHSAARPKRTQESRA